MGAWILSAGHDYRLGELQSIFKHLFEAFRAVIVTSVAGAGIGSCAENAREFRRNHLQSSERSNSLIEQTFARREREMTATTLQAPISARASGASRASRMSRQVGSSLRPGGVRACSGVVPADNRTVTLAGGELYWTRRGLAVAIFVISVFVAAVLATIVMQFLAVSDELPTVGEGDGVRSAAIHARG